MVLCITNSNLFDYKMVKHYIFLEILMYQTGTNVMISGYNYVFEKNFFLTIIIITLKLHL